MNVGIDYFIRTGINNTKTGMKNTLNEVQDIKHQIENLQKRAAALVIEGRVQAMSLIKEMMHDYTISATDLGLTFKAPARARNAEKKLPMRYQDPESKLSWAGRGRPPAWIDGKNYDDFLIDNDHGKARTQTGIHIR